MIGRLLSGVRSLFLAAEDVRTPSAGDQLHAGPYGGELSGRVEAIIGEFNPHRVTMERMLQMRHDPDVAFGTALVRAPIINMNWRIQSNDPQIAAYVDAVIRPHFRTIATALSLAMPFGYKVLERVWKAGPFSYQVEGKDGKQTTERDPLAWTFDQFKPINGESLTLLADEISGKFLGVRQSGYGSKDVTVGPEQLVLWSFRKYDVDGNLKGLPMYFQVYQPWHSKLRTLLYRDAYLMRDAQPVPIGRTVIDQVRDEKNVVRDGYSQMRRVLSARQAGAFVIISSKRDDKGNPLQDIEYPSNPSQAGDVYQRAIDKDGIQILRAFGITDEVGTSQDTGSRSRSKTHQETFNDTLQGFRDECVDQVINPQVVDDVVLYKYGREALEQSNTRLVADGISAGTLDTYADVLKSIMDGQAMLQQGTSIPLRNRIDAVEMCKALKVPLLPEDEVEPDPPAEPEGDPNDPSGGQGPVTPEQEAEAMKELKRRGASE